MNPAMSAGSTTVFWSPRCRWRGSPRCGSRSPGRGATSNAGTASIYFTGGEPFLHKDVLEILLDGRRAQALPETRSNHYDKEVLISSPQ